MKKEKQTQNQSVGRNVLIVVLILIILATSAFGIFAWARYQTTIQGESTAQVAKWNFKVTGDTTQTGQVAFPISRTDENTTVAEGTIAPGTYGEIPIEIDVTGTQTDLIYTIIGSMANLPRNLKIKSDSARTQEIGIEGQIFSRADYLKVADIGTETKIISEKIYWEWPFETGETAEDIKINNQEDTEDMGKPMTMALTVSGKQLNDAPVLADLVQVGDYVSYDADSNGTQTFTSEDNKDLPGTTISGTISTADKFDVNAKAQWRVLSVDRQTKKVELMSVEPTSQTVSFSGGQSFAYVDTLLDNIGGIYGNGNGAESARSITLEDIEKYSSYNKNEYVNPNFPIVYGQTRTYNLTKDGANQYFYEEIIDAEGKIVGYKDILTESTSEKSVTMTQTYYGYKALNYYKNSKIYDMIFKKSDNTAEFKNTYWIAHSRCVDNYEWVSSYNIRMLHRGSIDTQSVYVSNNTNRISNEYNVVPVVSLNTNIQTTGKVNDVWQLQLD